MRTVEDIEYELAFIENELVEREFTYLDEDYLRHWKFALNWVLERERPDID